MKDEALPFGVGGGLVAIKTLLSRDPCVHANTAIEMIDAILKEHSAAQHQCKWPTCQSEEYQQALAEQINQELVTGAAQPAPVPLTPEGCQILSAGDWVSFPLERAREAVAEGRQIRYLVVASAAQPAVQPTPANVWLYWKVDDKGVVTGPFKTDSKDVAYGQDCIDQTQLTVPAAQRQWVGLTDEDFIDLCEEASNFGTGGLIRHIEAKLKEKNI
jgi:hypothetical protein